MWFVDCSCIHTFYSKNVEQCTTLSHSHCMLFQLPPPGSSLCGLPVSSQWDPHCLGAHRKARTYVGGNKHVHLKVRCKCTRAQYGFILHYSERARVLSTPYSWYIAATTVKMPKIICYINSEETATLQRFSSHSCRSSLMCFFMWYGSSSVVNRATNAALCACNTMYVHVCVCM